MSHVSFSFFTDWNNRGVQERSARLLCMHALPPQTNAWCSSFRALGCQCLKPGRSRSYLSAVNDIYSMRSHWTIAEYLEEMFVSISSGTSISQTKRMHIDVGIVVLSDKAPRSTTDSNSPPKARLPRLSAVSTHRQSPPSCVLPLLLRHEQQEATTTQSAAEKVHLSGCLSLNLSTRGCDLAVCRLAQGNRNQHA